MEEEDKSLLEVRVMSLKCTRKMEVNKALNMTSNVYLPPNSQINSDFIIDILSDDKLVCHLCYSVFFTWDKVKIINVSQTEGFMIFYHLQKICQHK